MVGLWLDLPMFTTLLTLFLIGRCSLLSSHGSECLADHGGVAPFSAPYFRIYEPRWNKGGETRWKGWSCRSMQAVGASPMVQTLVDVPVPRTPVLAQSQAWMLSRPGNLWSITSRAWCRFQGRVCFSMSHWMSQRKNEGYIVNFIWGARTQRDASSISVRLGGNFQGPAPSI